LSRSTYDLSGKFYDLSRSTYDLSGKFYDLSGKVYTRDLSFGATKEFTGAVYINHVFENIYTGTLTGTNLNYTYTLGTTKSIIFVDSPANNFTFVVSTLPRTSNVSYTFTLIINTNSGGNKYYANQVGVNSAAAVTPKTNGTISITTSGYVIQQINVMYLSSALTIFTSVIQLA
jgi:hypothetical protein